MINITWFQNKDDIGIVFREYFNPIPLEAIALVLTMVRIEASSSYAGYGQIYALSLDRVLHRRMDYWNMQRVQLERSGLQSPLPLASQLPS